MRVLFSLYLFVWLVYSSPTVMHSSDYPFVQEYVDWQSQDDLFLVIYRTCRDDDLITTPVPAIYWGPSWKYDTCVFQTRDHAL
jgi:hypothetical protein